MALHRISPDTPGTAASEMIVTAALSARTTQPVIHISISYAEKPTQEQMKADSSRVLLALGLSENQPVVIAHDERDHQHIHIAANRFGPDGMAVSDSNNYAKIEATLRQIEAEWSWKAVEGCHAPSPAKRRCKSGQKIGAGKIEVVLLFRTGLRLS